MINYSQHFIKIDNTVREVLNKLNDLSPFSISFLIDEEQRLLGSVTDGDIRRGLLKGFDMETPIQEFIQTYPKKLKWTEFSPKIYEEFIQKRIKIIPIVDDEDKIIDILNLENFKSLIPVDAVIMAGGEGQRLRPLTLNTPKPLLKVGDKPIIEYNIERLSHFGVKNITVSLKYLGQQLVNYFGNGNDRNLSINYVWEDEPLGTIGAVSKIEDWYNNYILVMNSDLLTNIDYADMFMEMIQTEADMIVASTPYNVNIPYGVIESQGQKIVSLKEKPTYTYYSNAGIYIIKREYLKKIPCNQKFNATDLMECLISENKKVIHFPILGYWLDIGKPEDFQKAQQDIKHIDF